MDISKLVDELGALNKTANSHYKKYKELKEQEVELRLALQEALQASGLKSAKTSAFNASLSERVDFVLQHEQSALEWLENTPDVETDAYVGLKWAEFKTLAKQMLKDTGEVIPGLDMVRKETISIRSVK